MGVLSAERLELICDAYAQFSEELRASARMHEGMYASTASKGEETQMDKYGRRLSAGMQSVQLGMANMANAALEDRPNRLVVQGQGAVPSIMLIEIAHYLACLWAAYFVPYEFVYVPKRYGQKEMLHGMRGWDGANAALALDALADATFVAQIVIALLSVPPQFDAVTGVIETDKAKLRRMYVRTWTFALDVLSALPTGFVLVLAGVDESVPILYCVVRVLKLWRVSYVSSFWSTSRFAIKMPASLMKVASVLSLLLMLWHFCSFGFLFVARITQWSESTSHKYECWIDVFNTMPGGSFGMDTIPSQIFHSFFFVLTTVVTDGNDDILPVNDYERVFVIMLILVGDIAFAVCFGAVTSAIKGENKCVCNPWESTSLRSLRVQQCPALQSLRAVAHSANGTGPLNPASFRCDSAALTRTFSLACVARSTWAHAGDLSG